MFPYSEASWSAVDGAMFMGWGTALPGITTLIAAAILFAFGSGPVKGFAITLGIGIVTTLFTAYFLARHLTSLVVLNNNKETKICN